jgi:hypothetical protein
LAGDVVERPIAYAGSDRVCRALATDPALRALPSSEVARRLGTTRAHVESAIHGLVTHYTGHRLQVSGRSFDEAISDAGSARRAALSPEPINEAAGFASAMVRRGAGQTFTEHHAQLMRAPSYVRTRTGRRVASFDARGYQTPPIPDLSMLLLSDAFPVTRRKWSRGNTPTDDEIAILNWQHPLVKNASSAQSMATLKAISAGCYSWDTPVNVGGNQLAARTAEQRANFWLEMQQIMSDLSAGNLIYAPNPNFVIHPSDLGWQPGYWGLMPPKITADETDIWYWYLADASHPYLKQVPWMTQALLKLGANESVLDATWGKGGARQMIYTSGGKTYLQYGEGGDVEKDLMKLFAGLGGIVGALTNAVAGAIAVYCPACSVAVKIAGNLAQGAAKGAVNVKALASYGDQMLTDAAIKARNGDASAQTGMREFAAALIGLPHGATSGAQANGGLVKDYLDTLGSAPGNIAWALQVYAQDHSNKIQNAATLAQAAGVPLIDAQYAVAAMTDTLARFASNVSTVYLDPNVTGLQRAQQSFIAAHSLQFGKKLIPASLSDLPLVEGNKPGALTTGEKVAVAGAAVGVAWYMGLLKGLL